MLPLASTMIGSIRHLELALKLSVASLADGQYILDGKLRDVHLKDVTSSHPERFKIATDKLHGKKFLHEKASAGADMCLLITLIGDGFSGFQGTFQGTFQGRTFQGTDVSGDVHKFIS